jgi:hypothetical protein
MTSSPEVAGRGRAAELPRWVLVVPSAAVARLSVEYAGSLISRLAAYGWGTSAQSQFVHYLQLLVFHGPKESAFVIIGAKMAPTNRRATSIVLAAVAILYSLMVHVFSQPRPGITNYTHFAMEAAGGVFGVVYVICGQRVRSDPGEEDANRAAPG